METVPIVKGVMPRHEIVGMAARGFKTDYLRNHTTRRRVGLGRSARQAQAFLDKWAADPEFPKKWGKFKPPQPKSSAMLSGLSPLLFPARGAAVAHRRSARSGQSLG